MRVDGSSAIARIRAATSAGGGATTATLAFALLVAAAALALAVWPVPLWRSAIVEEPVSWCAGCALVRRRWSAGGMSGLRLKDERRVAMAGSAGTSFKMPIAVMATDVSAESGDWRRVWARGRQ
eukprot:3632164-Pleurochrysis_carterae.AAC.7